MIRVLYAEDDPTITAVVSRFFETYGEEYALETVPTGRGCLARMADGGVDVLLLDLILPDIDGLHVLGELAMRYDLTPVVLVSGHGQNDLAVRALRAGAVDCVDKSSKQFLQVVEIVKRVHAEHTTTHAATTVPPTHSGPFRIMLIENETHLTKVIGDFLKLNAPQVTLVTSTTVGELKIFVQGGMRADAIVIGPNPTGARPLDILRQLRSTARHIPVLMLSDRSDGETAVAAFKLGAQDYILQQKDYLTELVFSLSNIFRRVAVERQNAQLASELEALNHSLEAQVVARTSELRALSSRLLRIQEDERRAIARELHDQVGQMLTGLKFQLEAAAAQAGPAAQDKLAEASVTAAELLRHVRELTQLYRPRILDDLGLKPALLWHANQFQRQTSVVVNLDLDLPPDRLPSELETAIFRIIQEALTNIARHAQCETAHVTIATAEQHLLVEISDRGRGFDLALVLARPDAIGLAGLSERVNLAGGRLEIFSQPGQGTRLHVEFPLPSPSAVGGPVSAVAL